MSVTASELRLRSHPAGFGQYTIVREVGRGGMATVYEAVHATLGKRVALKVMRTDAADRPNAAARFFREARAAAQIRHPHVINVFDVGSEGEIPFIVMDLVDGPDLAKVIAERTSPSLSELADLFLPVVAAVWSAHKVGIVHRDLKPSNILLADFPRGITHPVVVDFGISKMLDEPLDSPLTRSESVLGTVQYLSPEQTRGAKFATELSDQYALGVMLYECATGTRPFRGESTYELMHAIVTASVPKPSQIDPRLPRAFDAIVMRAMQRDGSKRFPSVHALGCALLSFASDAGWARWGAEFTSTTTKSDGLARASNQADTAADSRELHVLRVVGKVDRLAQRELLGSTRWTWTAGFGILLGIATIMITARTSSPPARPAAAATPPPEKPSSTVTATALVIPPKPEPADIARSLAESILDPAEPRSKLAPALHESSSVPLASSEARPFRPETPASRSSRAIASTPSAASVATDSVAPRHERGANGAPILE